MPDCNTKYTLHSISGLSVLLIAAATAALAGCSQALQTPLPELSTISRHLLSDAEQKKAIQEMNQEGQRHEADAIAQIERDRATASGGTAARPAPPPLTNTTQ
jgi:hypothetical protein